MLSASLLARFKSARSKSVPIIAVCTPDPRQTVKNIATVTNGSPLILWDCVSGLQGLNPPGRDIVMTLPDPNLLTNVTEVLSIAAQFPPDSILFCSNMDRFISNEFCAQGIWNLRDLFKIDRRTLVLFAPSLILPASLKNDVVILDEALPDSEELAAIVRRLYSDASLSAPNDETVSRATDAVCGLSAFSAEQSAAMSLTRDGLDLQTLWESKRKQIEQTKGLSVWRGGETFEDIGGCENVKTFLRAILAGNKRPRAIVFIDEIEKQLAGTSGDSSGVSQEMLGTLLTFMQDTSASGIIAVGPPGAAKSAIAKAAGNTGNIPTIAFDLSGMKGSLVGESGENMRNALKVVTAVSQGETLFIATCNAIASLPPELRRRFTFGTFFFDLPSANERRIIWDLYLRKFSLDSQPIPSDDSWTGAEIRQCCDLAYRLRITLVQAATYVVPVAKSASESIERLRTQASGKFISASVPGIYRYEKPIAAMVGGRSLEVN